MGRKRLNAKLRATEQRTKSKIVLVTLESIHGRDQKAFAMELFNTWRVGQTEENGGILTLFVADGGASGRGRIQVEVSQRFNGAVSHSWTTKMLEESVLPQLRAREYEVGFAKCVDRIEPRLTRKRTDGSSSDVPLLVGSVTALAAVPYLERKSRKCDMCDAVVPKRDVTPWHTVRAATHLKAGRKQRRLTCQACGALSVQHKSIPKYDGRRQRSDGSWHYYYDSSSNDGGGFSDGGGGGGGDC